MKYTERRTLKAVAGVTSPCTPDIAKSLGITTRAAWRRLSRLEANGLVWGNTSTYPQTSAPVVYWHLTDAGRQTLKRISRNNIGGLTNAEIDALPIVDEK